MADVRERDNKLRKRRKRRRDQRKALNLTLSDIHQSILSQTSEEKKDLRRNRVEEICEHSSTLNRSRLHSGLMPINQQ